ncbi:MAG TPA: OmpH family outer membrane protein [Candidatus Methylomirabilis sp.]
MRGALLVAGGLLAGAVGLIMPGARCGPAGAAEAATPESVRVGAVDMQAVILQSAKGQRAQATLKAEFESKQKDLNAREEEIRKLQADLERQKAVLSQAALREKEESIQRRIRDIRRTGEDMQRDMQKREAELVGEIQRDIMQVIVEYGKEKGYNLILERGTGAVWFVNERADLTKDIIERYNAKAK